MPGAVSAGGAEYQAYIYNFGRFRYPNGGLRRMQPILTFLLLDFAICANARLSPKMDCGGKAAGRDYRVNFRRITLAFSPQMRRTRKCVKMRR